MLPADHISLYFPTIRIFRVFCQKEEDFLPLFHKMLEGLLKFHLVYFIPVKALVISILIFLV